VSLPPASSFFESTQPSHQNPSTPFHSTAPLVEPSNEPYMDQQYNPNYVNQGYINPGISSDFGQSYGGVYNPHEPRFPQMEMYPPPPIPMMQPPAPPEYTAGMMPTAPMMYPPGQFQQPQWNQNEFRQNPPFGQPMMTELRNFQGQNQVETPANINVNPDGGIQENNFVPNFQNPRIENFQQLPPQNYAQNQNFIPPHTTSEYSQPQYPPPQVPQGPQYPDPRSSRSIPMDQQTQGISKSNDSTIADTVAEVIAKQKAKIFEEQEGTETPTPHQKKRRYVPTLEPPFPEDGPTVKEHLKKKQMEKKIQEKQEILKQKILEDEEKRKSQSQSFNPESTSAQYSTLEESIPENQGKNVFENAVENPSLSQEVVPEEVFQVKEEVDKKVFLENQRINEKMFMESPGIGEIDTEVQARIEEIGGFDGSTVGELAESIEGVPGQSGRKRKRPSKPRKKPIPKVEPVQKENDEKYLFKALHLQNTVRSLVLKNTALADEVSRLIYRIKTATEERSILAKRLQHYERNRIRRVLTQKKKKQALQALLLEEEFSRSSSVDDQGGFQQDFQVEKNEAIVPAFAFDEIRKGEMTVLMPFAEMENLRTIPILNLNGIDNGDNQIDALENPDDAEKSQKTKSRTDKQKNPAPTNRIPRRTPRKRKIEEKETSITKRSKKEELDSDFLHEQEASFFDEVSWAEPELEEVFSSEIPPQTTFISPRKRATMNRSETPSSSRDSSSRPESSQSGSVRTRSRRRNGT
ncbi:hypothetical protein FO519_003203, partial [Halicephalobus sp. NKZ332]